MDNKLVVYPWYGLDWRNDSIKRMPFPNLLERFHIILVKLHNFLTCIFHSAI